MIFEVYDCNTKINPCKYCNTIPKFAKDELRCKCQSVGGFNSFESLVNKWNIINNIESKSE